MRAERRARPAPRARAVRRLRAGLVLLLAASFGGLLPGSSVASEDGAHAFHRHHFGLFLGAGSRPEKDEPTQHGFAVGVDYEYRFSQWIGAGAMVEAATGGLRDVIVLGLVYVHPWRGLLIGGGPGAEFSKHGSALLGRVGVAYQFRIPGLDRFTLAPSFNVDVVHSEPTYVYGLVLGVGF